MDLQKIKAAQHLAKIRPDRYEIIRKNTDESHSVWLRDNEIDFMVFLHEFELNNKVIWDWKRAPFAATEDSFEVQDLFILNKRRNK